MTAGPDRHETTSHYVVTGMTCAHCVAAVTAEVEAIATVRAVQVDLDTGALTVTSAGPLEVDAVRDAVDEAGYTLGPTRQQ